MTGGNRDDGSLRPAFVGVACYALLALAGLWVASWEPHTPGDPILRWIAYLLLGFCALWYAAGLLLVGYVTWKTHVQRRAGSVEERDEAP